MLYCCHTFLWCAYKVIDDMGDETSGDETSGDDAASGATDEGDWQAIYEEQLPRVFNFFRYRLRIEDDETAQDLTATTFEKAWRARNQYQRDLAAFSTWLFTIARNTANDYSIVVISGEVGFDRQMGSKKSRH